VNALSRETSLGVNRSARAMKQNMNAPISRNARAS
jgi:hypothetical protein